MDIFKAPFETLGAGAQVAPVILTSGHSGRCYPEAFLAASRLDAVAIRRSEDSFVEELFGAAPALGVPLLAANFPRAFCDVNREAWELDPSMFEDRLPDYVNAASPRVSAGLGTVARIVGSGEPIYRRKLKFAEAQARVAGCWQPYHAELQRLISLTTERFGVCLLIDCHSMPTMPAGRGGARQPDVVLGDVHGSSCATVISGFVDTKLSRLGLRVCRNDPYAGGYITRHYGRPREGVHVLQLEFSRALYMDEAKFEKIEAFAPLAAKVSDFIAAVRDVATALLPRSMNRLAAAE
ncbi:MAG TPA: N-formylglutamate amidohydrolase [Acidocella sp.]|nr:N-formylglutamate amidohydrolase [Acidocella sp.]HQU03471.1 N-formylglutamate amidohydrolase [Acidocella sp.]